MILGEIEKGHKPCQVKLFFKQKTLAWLFNPSGKEVLMKYFMLFLLACLCASLLAQPPVESPSAKPIPNVQTPPEMPKPGSEELPNPNKVGPGTSRPDNPNYKKEPAPKPKQAPNRLDTPKDTVKPGTLYTPK